MNYKRWTALGLGGLLFLPACWIDDSCVAEGAEIATPKGPRRIETLRIGDEVWALDPVTGQRHATRITAIRSSVRECLILELGSTSLTCTPDHPVYVAESATYEPAVHFMLGKARQLLQVDEVGARALTVVSVRDDAGLRRVFDITVESEHHNFIANGVLVHNKSPGCDIDGPPDDPASCNYEPTSSGSGTSDTGASTGPADDDTTDASTGESDSGSESGSESDSGSASDSGSESDSGSSTG